MSSDDNDDDLGWAKIPWDEKTPENRYEPDNPGLEIDPLTTASGSRSKAANWDEERWSDYRPSPEPDNIPSVVEEEDGAVHNDKNAGVASKDETAKGTEGYQNRNRSRAWQPWMRNDTRNKFKSSSRYTGHRHSSYSTNQRKPGNFSSSTPYNYDHRNNRSASSSQYKRNRSPFSTPRRDKDNYASSNRYRSNYRSARDIKREASLERDRRGRRHYKDEDKVDNMNDPRHKKQDHHQHRRY